MEINRIIIKYSFKRSGQRRKRNGLKLRQLIRRTRSKIIHWKYSFKITAMILSMCVSCSVVSDSLQPTSLLCPWNSTGKNTGMSCHFLLQGIFPTQGLMWPNPHCRQMLLPSELLENPMVLSKHSESRQRLLKFFILSEKARHNHIVFKGTYLKCKQKDK